MGKFVILPGEDGGSRFELKAGNGEIIAVSERYSSEDACKNGVESVRKNAPAAALEDRTVRGFKNERHPKFELYLDEGGTFRFRLKARNGEMIAASGGYTAKASCKNGIESVRRNAPDAEILVKEQ